MNFKLKSEMKVLKSQTELYKTKLSVTEELNKTLEQTIIELKNKIKNDNISYNQKNEQYSSSINKYKNIIEEMEKEKEKNENMINSLINEKKEINDEMERLNDEINGYKKYDEINNQLKQKIKK